MATILIVDDDAGIRDALQPLLERLGHRVQAAADGLEAIQHFDQGTFDLIISDVMMPEMNGFDLLHALQSRIVDRIPFIILSSHDDREAIKAALFAGAFDYILKPFDEERVRSVLERALTQRAAWAGEGGAVTRPPAVSFDPPPSCDTSFRADDEPRRSGPGGGDVMARTTKVVSVAAPATRRGAAEAKGARRWLARLVRRRRA